MSSVRSASPFATLTGAPSAIDADLLVVPWYEDESPAALTGLDTATAGEIQRALTQKEFQARPFDMFIARVTDRSWRAGRVALIGAGARGASSGDILRKVAAAAGLEARKRRVARAAFLVRGTGDAALLTQAVAEGLTLAEFYGGSYKTTEPQPAAPASWTIAFDGAAPAGVAEAVNRGRILGESSNLARALANEPGNTLTPREFAARASAIAAEGNIKVEILDERQLADLGMGMLLGVARGSSEPPRLMVFRHDPPGAPAAPVLGLVGKGITFDTGGISIKPADGMERMKDDMAGGAAVACAMRAIGLLRAPMRVVGVVPATENMPGGRAIKPGDILKSAEG
ncbi:MAG TPA: M17 family peptidase N-terminal domain-containing protein, partial [Vicinamibacterales bacterium]